MWLIVYNLLFPLLALVFLLVGCLGSRRRTFFKEITNLENLKERLAIHGANPEARTWFHAASLGEVKCLQELLNLIRGQTPRSLSPLLKGLPAGLSPIHLTTMTSAGKAWAQENYLKRGLVSSVALIPLDFWPCVSAYLDKMTKLRTLILVETELWPNLITYAKKRGLKLALINARVSNKSLRLRPVLAGLLNLFDVIGVSSEENLRRFQDCGAEQKRLILTGNLKWDFEPPPGLSNESQFLAIREHYGFTKDDFIWVAGSTREGEEAVILEAFKNLLPKYPHLRLVLVPRHLERVPQVKSIVNSAEISRHSRESGNPELLGNLDPRLRGGDEKSKVTLIDKFGVLTSLYAIADCVFVGGTLFLGAGGHNFLEPIAFGKSVVVGPYFENFKEVGELLIKRGVLRVAANARELGEFLNQLISNPLVARDLSQKSIQTTQDLRGATPKTYQLLGTVLNN